MTRDLNHLHIRDGFAGQRMLVLPRPVVYAQLGSPHAPGIIPTDIGYFPDAAGHEVDRPFGSSQMVIIVCVRGKGWVRFRGNTLPIEPGDVVVLPPDAPHAYGAADEHPWTIYWLHAAGRQIAPIYQLLSSGNTQNIFSIGKEAGPIELIKHIEDRLHGSYSANRLLIAGLTTARLMEMLITLHEKAVEPPDLQDRIKQTIELARRRLTSPVSVPELARMANLSPSHFAAVFKQYTGYPVLEFFIRLRMQRAAHLLDTTTMPIKRIAGELGYLDPMYFSRAFRKIHDVSPAQYRAIKKG